MAWTSKPAAGATANAASGGKQFVYSTLQPWIVQDHAGTCPNCGMDLVPLDAQLQADWERAHPG